MPLPSQYSPPTAQGNNWSDFFKKKKLTLFKQNLLISALHQGYMSID